MNQRNIKFGGVRGKRNLFHEIICLENLFLAWQKFRRGKRNKFDVQEFEYNLEDNIFQLHQKLKNRTYKHSIYKSFYIQDPKLRCIHKACVKDRVLHHAIFRILYFIFDTTFIFDSYSCRIGKGTHRAVNRLQKFARKVSKNNTKTCYILKCDIKKFFDSIDHNILISLIRRKIKGENTIWLIKEIIKSFSTSIDRGLPLGNITSQLFANIYLNKLDQFMKHGLRMKYYIRYCDDFVIISGNKEYLKKIVPRLSIFLDEELKISLHYDKITMRKYYQGIDFLGYVSFPYHRVLRTKTKRRMFEKIEQRAKALKQNKISKKSFDQSFQSYLGMLKHCNSYKIKQKLFSLFSNTIYA